MRVDQVATGGGHGVDQAAQLGRLLKQVVQRGHAAFQPRVAFGQLEPVRFLAARRNTHAGNIQARQGPVTQGLAFFMPENPERSGKI